MAFEIMEPSVAIPAGVEPDRVTKLLSRYSAVDEAFTNVVEHAFDPDEDATFKIICTHIPLGLKIAIREKGMPFDPAKIPEYDPTTSLEEQSGEGLGFYLMKQSMDEVQFNNLGKQGKETCLIKYLPKKSMRRFSYTAVSVPEEQLPVKFLARYVQLPDGLERVSEFAYNLIDQNSTLLEKAIKIEYENVL